MTARFEEFTSPQDFILKYPLSNPSIIDSSRKTLINILEKKDPRFVIILGPCSIDDSKAAIEYAQKVASLQKEVASRFFLIMRVYLEKPRTSAGWKGLLLEPHLNETFNPMHGISESRLLLNEISNLNVPIATEFLSPFTAPFIQDFITWGSIGARTTGSMIHRQLASQLPMPIGFKNSVEGCIESSIHGIKVAISPQKSLCMNDLGKISILETTGNPYSHLVLRGGTITGPNFDLPSIQKATLALKLASLPQNILIDCSHQNSGKVPQKQLEVFSTLMNYREQGFESIYGAMLESYLVEGAQKEPLVYGKSLTDPCLGWEETKQLLLKSASCYV